jgi:hypothetical protein
MAFICKDCSHWEGDEHSFSAGCRIKVYDGLVAFDRADPPCMEHTGLERPAPAVVAPTMVQMFVPPGVKTP